MNKRVGVFLVFMFLLAGCSKKESVPTESSTTQQIETFAVPESSSSVIESTPEETESLEPAELAKQEIYSALKAESEAAATAPETSESDELKNLPQVDYSRCVLYDIDMDGVEECFLDTSEGLIMYTFSDQVVSKPISFSIGSDLYFTDDNDCFYVYTNTDGYESWFCYAKGFDNESLYLLNSCEFSQYADENDEVQTEVYFDGDCVYGPDIDGYPDGLEEVMKSFKPEGVFKAEWSISLEDAFK